MGFSEDLNTEPVNTLPIRNAPVVQPDTSIKDAIAAMLERSLGCAVIVDPSGSPTGLFTEQSLLDALSNNPDLEGLTVSNYSDPAFLVVNAGDPIMRVWDAIENDGLRFVCVVDDHGKLVGVTGQRGIAEYVAECFARQVVVQRLGSTPWMNQREGA